MAIYKCGGRERFTRDGEPFCSYEAPLPWDGQRCPGCGRWYPIRRYGPVAAAKDDKRLSSFAAVADDDASKLVHVATGLSEVDRILGGGLVPGYVTLVGGQRSSGKSTLLMMLAFSFARASRPALYVTGEQTALEVGTYARRLELKSDHVKLLASSDVDEVIEYLNRVRPDLLVLDSLQRMESTSCPSPKGSTGQGLAVLGEIRPWCKKHKCSALIINHLSKDGGFAGSETVQHDVDGVLAIAFPDEKFPEDRPYLHDYAVRVLVVEKTRQGGENTRAYYRMTDAGLKVIEPDQEEVGGGGFSALLKKRIGKS